MPETRKAAEKRARELGFSPKTVVTSKKSGDSFIAPRGLEDDSTAKQVYAQCRDKSSDKAKCAEIAHYVHNKKLKESFDEDFDEDFDDKDNEETNTYKPGKNLLTWSDFYEDLIEKTGNIEKADDIFSKLSQDYPEYKWNEKVPKEVIKKVKI